MLTAPGKHDVPGGVGKNRAELGAYLTLGLQLAVSVVAFFFLGRWLDSELNTAPWLMIIGAMVGAVGGMISFLRTATKLGKKEDERTRTRKESEEQ